MISHLAPLSLCLAAAAALRVETHVNGGISLDMVSSLIIGSEAAALIDLPMAIPQAKTLAGWVRATTDKPLVAVFTTHSHPDHYLSGAEVLAQFPEAKYYANPDAAAQIGIEAPVKAQTIGGAFGVDNISQRPAVPAPYDFSFFALPGDEESPIYLLSPLTGDTVHETLFWVPSAKTLIAGDAVYGSDIHLWLADLLTPELTESWLTTLDLVESLSPSLVVPGHALSNTNFGPASDVKHSRDYLHFWQTIEKKGLDFYTPEEIFSAFDKAFPKPLSGNNTASSTFLLNATAGQFGRGGTRQQHMIDLSAFNSTAELDGWKLISGVASTGCH
ncbi:metallo-beta-lactamase family protein [Plectosphaerella plurivora]|uniref:Metallo-beta-lactamase family protein n=1 Tax=Plectosphaerella plurivora TaxID=936078 RepID=A0A9P8V864_9PEZI|nr:metallo-beta-lactamase family protein [Plectosphaerella plurivora]